MTSCRSTDKSPNHVSSRDSFAFGLCRWTRHNPRNAPLRDAEPEKRVDLCAISVRDGAPIVTFRSDNPRANPTNRRANPTNRRANPRFGRSNPRRRKGTRRHRMPHPNKAYKPSTTSCGRRRCRCRRFSGMRWWCRERDDRRNPLPGLAVRLVISYYSYITPRMVRSWQASPLGTVAQLTAAAAAASQLT